MTTTGQEMTRDQHVATALEFLEHSDQCFETGDLSQGSGKLWGAFSYAITAVSQERGWPYGSRRNTIEAARALAGELDDRYLLVGLAEARSLHTHFHHGALEDYEVEMARPIVRNSVLRILGLLNGNP